jgi:hypothetical protein
VAAHLQRLLALAGCRPPPPAAAAAAAAAAPEPGAPARKPLHPVVGPASLGISPAEAARLPPAEWGACVAAAAKSVADGLAPGGAGPASGGAPAAGPAPIPAPDLPALAAALVGAHRAAQNGAAALRGMGAGPRRRYLSELCGAIEARVDRLEPLLIALPSRQEGVDVSGLSLRAVRWLSATFVWVR